VGAGGTGSSEVCYGGPFGAWAAWAGKITAPALVGGARRTPPASTLLILVTNMACTIPSVRAATLAETTPAARPAASRLAALIVDATKAGAADGDADPAATTAATDPPESTTPRWVSRFASNTLALASRLATLPSGMPSCRAASLRVMPSRAHSTRTPR